MVIKSCETNCGPSFIDQRIVILTAIAMGNFNDSLIDSLFFRDAARNQAIYDPLNNKQSSDYNSSPYYKIFKNYITFENKLADSLLSIQDKGTIEYLICLYFSGKFDDFYSELKTNNFYKKSKLMRLYESEIKRLIRIPQNHYAFFVGGWIPTGNSQLLGNHPNIGLIFGWKYWKIATDFFLSFKFLDATNNYQIQQNDSIYSVNHFLGGHFGLDLGFEIFRSSSFEIDLYTGIGADGFDALTKDLSAEDKALSVFEMNINPGAEFRYYYESSKLAYLGIRARYNIVDYNQSKEIITDLSGQKYSIDLIWGFCGEPWRNNTLKALRSF